MVGRAPFRAPPHPLLLAGSLLQGYKAVVRRSVGRAVRSGWLAVEAGRAGDGCWDGGWCSSMPALAHPAIAGDVIKRAQQAGDSRAEWLATLGVMEWWPCM